MRSLAAVAAFCLSLSSLCSAPIPPLVCPAGGPIGSVDLRVSSPRGGGEALPLRTINRLEEGDVLIYKPLLRSGESRKGEVTLVLVPVNPSAAGEKLRILDPKSAGETQKWQVPFRVAVVAYVYGPSGLNVRRVRNFLSRDEDLIAQLADYAEKTAQTEALIAALSSTTTSADAVRSAFQGFASQYGLGAQIDKNAPANQQAMALFRTLNPAIASYDPIAPQGTQQFSQTASLATSVATLFFGSPVGLAAGGTAMLLELKAIAFPKSDFRSSFSQLLPNEGLGLCGRRDRPAPHTKVAFLWASRVPNVGPPQIAIEKTNNVPVGQKSAVPVSVPDSEWKVAERARKWMLEPEEGKAIPVEVQKLGAGKALEIDVKPELKPGKYTLVANWDWHQFRVKGEIEVKELSKFMGAHLKPSSQDLLVEKTGKVPVTLEGDDFEFVNKVEIKKVNDKFATSSAVPFVLPKGLRQGLQLHIDLQINTIDLDSGDYELLLTQLDGKAHSVKLKILPEPPAIENLPVVINQGTRTADFELKGRRLDLLQRLLVPRGTAILGEASADHSRRQLHLKMADDVDAGTSLAVKAYVADRAQPLTFADAVRIVGPRPSIVSISMSQPAGQKVQLFEGELPGGVFLSAMIRAQHLQSNSALKLDCEQTGGVVSTVRLGERAGAATLQQLSPEQLFLSFDTAPWFSGCKLRATVINGRDGDSAPFPMGTIVRVPDITRFEVTGLYQAQLTGRSLETIAKIGWSEDQGQNVEDLPLPTEIDRQPQQTLQLKIPPPPDAAAKLYLWLRGDTKPRSAAIPVTPPL